MIEIGLRIRRRHLITSRRDGGRKTSIQYQVVARTEIVDRFDFLEAALDQYPNARVDQKLFRRWQP